MKVVVFSDIHLHEHRFGSTLGPDGRNSRLAHGLDALAETLKPVAGEGAVARLFCGDLFHVRGKITPSVFNPAFESFSGAHGLHDFADVLLVGNHDMQHRSEGDHALSAFREIDGCHVLDGHGYALIGTPEGKLGIGYVSYSPDVKTLKERVEQVAAMARIDDVAAKKVFLLHHGVDGAMPNIPDMGFAPNHLPTRDFDFVFCGDYHNHKQLADNAWMVGATMQHTFGDAGEARGYMVVDLDTAEAELREISCAPRFVTWDEGKRAPKAHDCNGNFVRVRADDEDKLAKMQQLVEKAGALAVQAELVRDWKAIERSDTSLSLTTRELFASWLDTQALHGLDRDALIRLNDSVLGEAGVA